MKLRHSHELKRQADHLPGQFGMMHAAQLVLATCA
jgi:hypothetical protein